MEYRQLGGSGFKVPVLSLGTGTFGGGNEFFKAWEPVTSRRPRARRHLPRRRPQHVRLRRRLFRRRWPRRSSGRRSRAGATRCSSRPRRRSARATARTTSARRGIHLIRAVEGSLQAARHRLHRPLPAARLRRADAGRGRRSSTLDDLVRAGKIRYIGCSNFSGWHLMKSLAVSETLRLAALRRAPGVLLARSAATTSGS